jgi:hypothetical protein
MPKDTADGKKNPKGPSDVPNTNVSTTSGTAPWQGLPDGRPDGGSNLKG